MVIRLHARVPLHLSSPSPPFTLPLPATYNGAASTHTHIRQHTRHHWHDLLVRPARPANIPQLPDEVHTRTSRGNDVPLVVFRRPFRHIRHRPEIQYPLNCTTAVLLSPLSCELGAMFVLWAVSMNTIHPRQVRALVANSVS